MTGSLHSRQGYARIWISILTAGVLHFALSTIAFAAQKDPNTEIDAAQRLLAKGDYAQAYKEFSKHSSNSLAQFSIALFHQFGWGRAVDPAAACVWFGKAAKGSIPAAQHFYAECLRYGVGGPADPTAAASFYQAAAKNGHWGSLCPLAELYFSGSGVPKNPAEGLALCQIAADRGISPAQVRLGRFYSEEEEIRNYAAAEHWFELAARGNFAEAQYLLARMLEAGVAHEPDTVSARNWYEAAAAQGYLPAYLPVAKLYAASSNSPESILGEVELAKAYVWSTAASQLLQGADQAEAKTLRTQLVAQVPTSWLPNLDAKVTDHLKRVSVSPAATP